MESLRGALASAIRHYGRNEKGRVRGGSTPNDWSRLGTERKGLKQRHQENRGRDGVSGRKRSTRLRS